MSSEQLGGLDDLMMGNVSEEVSESDEQIAARAQAVQAKLAALAKDEGHNKSFDQVLASIVSELDDELLQVVIFWIDHDVPSLTILALLGLVNNTAYKVCKDEFHHAIEERADFGAANISDEKILNRLEHWWTYIVGADLTSKTVQMKDFIQNTDIHQAWQRHIGMLVSRFFASKDIQYDADELKKLLTQASQEIFYAEPT